MAVKTRFAQNDFVQILAGYELGALRDFQPISAGNVQTTYRLETTHGKFIFRYYENRSLGSVLFEGELIQYLNAQQYPCPAILSNRRGICIQEFRGKPYALFDFVEGEHLENPSREQQRQLIEQVAALHNLTQNFVPRYQEHRWNYNVELCRMLAQQAATKIGTSNARAKLEWYERELGAIQLPDSLPQGICHCDFHFSNILFKDGEFKALIDFDDANYTYLTYDLATLIEPFKPAFAWDTWQNFTPDADVLDFGAGREVVAAYRQYRELNREEQAHLFDVYKLGVMLDCIWYFERGDVEDFYERRKIEQLNRLGRENFQREILDTP